MGKRRTPYWQAHDDGNRCGLQLVLLEMREAHTEAVRVDNVETIYGIAECIQIVETELEKL